MSVGSYFPKTTPRQHQRDALAALAKRPAGEDVFAWLMEMGTGKSKVILDEWGARVTAGELRDLLIIAPAGAYRNWWRVDDEDPGEVQKHLGGDLYERVVLCPWISGAGKTHQSMVESALRQTDRPRIFVMNVEALSTVSAAQEACRTFLRGGRGMIVVDESTSIKGFNSRRTLQLIGGKKVTQGIMDLAPARRIATGLVAPRDPLDLWSQFAFLDWRILGSRSFYGFRSRYAIMKKMDVGGRRFDIVVGYRDVEELHQRIAPWSFRCLKEDCLDLDPKTYSTREVTLTPNQVRMYKELKEHATAALDATTFVTATQVITQLLRLDQLLCGHVVDEQGGVHDVTENRTSEVLQLLGEHSGKAIIWTAYDRCVRKLAAAIEKEFGKESVACFWGANRTTRGEDEQRFKTDPRCRFMVATPGAGGRGNTWVVADLVIYHSNTDNLEHRAQSEDRAHRDGQTKPVHYVDLVARGTVDEKKLKALRAKINMATVINGDNYREWLI